jgi:hypothetical protein
VRTPFYMFSPSFYFRHGYLFLSLFFIMHEHASFLFLFYFFLFLFCRAHVSLQNSWRERSNYSWSFLFSGWMNGMLLTSCVEVYHMRVVCTCS